jgi:peptide/nickel transport system permease protein
MPARWRVSRPWQFGTGCAIALVVAHWHPALAVAGLAVWTGAVYRQLLAEWTAALRFDPRRIVTTPALLFGLVICLGLLLVALFPARFAPFDPSYQTAVLQTIDGRVMAAPFPPRAPFLLGTDAARHDLLSRLLYGTGSTLGVAVGVVALRLALGCGLGWVAGWHGGRWGDAALVATAVSATVPALLFAWVFIVAIGPGSGFAVFVLGLGLTGWAHWTQLLHDEIRRLRRQPFMEAATAVGVPARRQLSHYLVPNLLPLLIAVAAQEVAAALLLLAELGFLGVFYGHGTVINPADLDQGAIAVPFHDWAGMLAGTRFEIFRNWWLPLAPAGAFLIAILGFNLLGDGLRQELELPGRRPRLARRRRRRRPFARATADQRGVTADDASTGRGGSRRAPGTHRHSPAIDE